MIIYFDSTTLDAHHVMTYHSDEIHPAANGENYIVTDRMISFDRIYIYRDENGVPALSEKKDMDIELLADKIVLGHDAIFMGIPKGVSIVVNGEYLGDMDASGMLEFTPKTTGFYKALFWAKGYMDKEIDLEVVGGN